MFLEIKRMRKYAFGLMLAVSSIRGGWPVNGFCVFSK
jgi:hypothetical protein